MKLLPIPLHWLRRAVTAGLLGSVLAATQAAPLDDMVAFDAAYIPALAATTGAAQDSGAAPRAAAAWGALEREWPALRRRLDTTWPGGAPPGWRATLDGVDRRIREAGAAVSRADWSAAHEVLEQVRADLMAARRRQGMDYFVDRLTAYHEPMEALALAAVRLQPAQLDAAQRDRLERAYAHARALWREVERQPIDARAYRLTPARETQLRKALGEEAAALERLSQALRGGDGAAVLKAAAGVKPSFARAYTAFARAEGETTP